MLLCGAVLLMASPAFAEEVPAVAGKEPTMRSAVYDQTEVVKIVCAAHRSCSVQFAADENVESLLCPDTYHQENGHGSWLITAMRKEPPRGNMVFITPFDGGDGLHPTNMQIVTSRPDGSHRLYHFNLVVAQDDKDLMAGVTFKYPADELAKRRQAAIAARAVQARKIAYDRLNVDFMYGERNWNYEGRGSANIIPTEVSDNRQMTSMRFPGNSPIPAVYAGLCGAKTEAMTNSHMEADVLVVQTTAQYFCLRNGAEVAEIRNDNYDRVGVNPMTGTTTPEVTRTIKGPGV
jgi:type IV secretion system protein VirB9